MMNSGFLVVGGPPRYFLRPVQIVNCQKRELNIMWMRLTIAPLALELYSSPVFNSTESTSFGNATLTDTQAFSAHSPDLSTHTRAFPGASERTFPVQFARRLFTPHRQPLPYRRRHTHCDIPEKQPPAHSSRYTATERGNFTGRGTFDGRRGKFTGNAVSLLRGTHLG